MNILPGMPRDSAGPVFNAPWEARAFALAVQLHERGLFTWPQWARALSREIAAAEELAVESSYYEHWLRALESMVESSGAGSAAELERYHQAWHHAALRTPHGEPIELSSEDHSQGA